MEEASGLGWTRALHPEDQEAAGQAFLEASAQRIPYQYEYRLRKADGGWAWVIDVGQPRFSDDGRFEGYVGSVLDISQRRAMEAALRESEDHYRLSVELNPQIPWTATPEGLVSEVRPRLLKLMGMSLEDKLGEGWAAALHPVDLEPTQDVWARCLLTGEPLDVECRLRLADGSHRWFRVRAAARRDAEGRIIRWYGTVEDIQDRKLAQEALKESEAFARGVLESSPDCIRVLNLEGELVFMNNAGYDLLEVERGSDQERMSLDAFVAPNYAELLRAQRLAAWAGQPLPASSRSEGRLGAMAGRCGRDHPERCGRSCLRDLRCA